jgi:two-component system, cell cycle sensor histidine kinase and response regulator CckA
LQEAGYTVLTAATGEEGLRLYAAHGGTIDLLLTDVVMPGLSGPKVVRHILSSRSTVKVLYMSGYATDAIGHHGTLDTGTAFLQKPFTPDTLIRKVRAMLDAPCRDLSS